MVVKMVAKSRAFAARYLCYLKQLGFVGVLTNIQPIKGDISTREARLLDDQFPKPK